MMINLWEIVTVLHAPLTGSVQAGHQIHQHVHAVQALNKQEPVLIRIIAALPQESLLSPEQLLVPIVHHGKVLLVDTLAVAMLGIIGILVQEVHVSVLQNGLLIQ